jgi:hypothetical protein
LFYGLIAPIYSLGELSFVFYLQHLVDHRSGQLNGAQLLNLETQLVGRPSGKEVSVYSAANAGKPKRRNKSLLMLAAESIFRGLVAEVKHMNDSTVF